MYKKSVLSLGLVFLAMSLACTKEVSGPALKGMSGSIQIKGSDTMVNLAQAWAEAYMAKNPEAFVAVTGGGSGTGIASLLNGTCEIAQTSRQVNQKEMDLAKQKGITLTEFTVALDGLAIVVHPGNPVHKLTIDQVADIFTGKIKNWEELGGYDLPIVILSREVNSGTHVYFKEHVLRRGDTKRSDEFADSALLMSSSQAIADEISQNPNAIGYYGMGYLSPHQKVVALANDKNSPFYEPTLENVMSGGYYISRPLLMYTKDKPEGLVKDFINFVLSQEGQQIVRDVDFVPVQN